jgi:hypothetical protein
VTAVSGSQCEADEPHGPRGRLAAQPGDHLADVHDGIDTRSLQAYLGHSNILRWGSMLPNRHSREQTLLS